MKLLEDIACAKCASTGLTERARPLTGLQWCECAIGDNLEAEAWGDAQSAEAAYNERCFTDHNFAREEVQA